MFGYLTAYRDRLDTEERETYEGFYCGLCRSLGEKFGKKGRLILTYDLVFLAMLLNGLYEEPMTVKKGLCTLKTRKVNRIRTEALDYAADMNLLLAYQNFYDKTVDSHTLSAVKMLKLLRRDYRKTGEKYPRQRQAVEAYMEALLAYEKAPDENPDYAANLTGTMLAEIFVREEDAFSGYLRALGFSLGKFVYLMDAYCDLSEDLEKGNYNPYAFVAKEPGFEELSKHHLESVMSEAAASFEKLPLFVHREILRNILYAGAWLAYGKAHRKDKER